MLSTLCWLAGVFFGHAVTVSSRYTGGWSLRGMGTRGHSAFSRTGGMPMNVMGASTLSPRSRSGRSRYCFRSAD